MARTALKDLNTVPGKVTKTGLQHPPDFLHNLDMICLADGGLMLMLTNDKIPGRLVSYQNDEWHLIKDFKREQFEKGYMTMMPDQSVLVMSTYGDIHCVKDGKAKAEGPIPDENQMMCSISCIDGMAYAVGTERNLWKRVSAGNWISVHDPMQHPGLDDLTGLDMGFQTISASGPDDIYISGYAADTWHFNGQSWEQIALPWQDIPSIKRHRHPSPPSITSSVMTPDGVAYLSGSSFTLLRGRGHDWEVIDLSALPSSRAKVGGLTWFQNRLYFGSYEGSTEIASIGDDGIVQPLLQDDKPVYADCLCASEDHLYVCGSVGVVRSLDGVRWTAL